MNFDTAFDRLIGHEGECVEIERILRRALYEESSKYSTSMYTPANSRSYDCAIKGCDNKAYAKGLCNAHYLRQRKGMDMDFPVRSRKRGIGCIDCGVRSDAKGGWMRCQLHYSNRRRLILKTAAIAALGAKCQRCDGTFPGAVFDFHHRGEKNFAIGNELLNKSIRELAEELDKCDLLCSNCHRMEHNNGF